jgi:hypothetical protein
MVHNALRHKHSRGHLAREYNAALLRGFGELGRGLTDVVVLLQGDAKVKETWARELYEEHMGAGTLFLTQAKGDAIQSLTEEGVRTIGIWDEHYTDVGFQEADYFSARAGSPDRVRVADDHHHRNHRPWARTSLLHEGPGTGPREPQRQGVPPVLLGQCFR